MSLWTPYAADTPLDLSKTLKQEQPSPVQAYYRAELVAYAPADVAAIHPAYYAGCYPPPPAYGVPSTQLSPLSGASTCSGSDAPGYRRPAPSPPDSPASMPPTPTCSSYMMDADAMSDEPEFQAFEREALRAMAEKNGGALLGNNPRMRRAVRCTSQAAGDDSYRKQRERNNAAAKQSRDRRKLREIHLALKVAFLKRKVAALNARLAVQACSRCHRPCDC